MRILHVIHSLDPVSGGPPMVASRVAANQAVLGHDVTILAHPAAERDPGASAVPGMDRVKLAPVTIGRGWSGRVNLGATRRAIDPLLRKTDVVHLHGVWDPILPIAANAAARARVPYVICAHGMLQSWSLRQRWFKKWVALAVVYRRMLHQAAAFHALSSQSAREIGALGFNGQVHVVPNGVCPREIAQAPPAGAFYEAHPELRGRPYLVYFGRVHYKKGIDLLIDALATLARAQPDLQLVVQGPDGGKRAALRQRAAHAGLAERVHFFEPCYGPERLAALRDAACFCLTSRQEGFSIAVIEALACGTPVVISDACCFPEVVSAGAGVVAPLEPAAIARCIGDVISSDRAARAIAGRRLVHDHYTWPLITNRVIAMYQAALAGRALPISRDQQPGRAAG